jgi:tRNA-dihydrouridine synthase A
MKDPALVATGVKAMQAEVDVPVTVKCRIGVDEHDSEEALINFIETVHSAGCNTFIIHARKAWLQGLSPKENREIPPLNYPLVYKIKALFPELTIVINGGVQSLEQTEEHLQQVDGVMLGRVAYQNPWLLQNVDARFFGSENPSSSRREVIEKLIPYAKEHIAQQGRLQHIARHILGLYQDIPGAKVFRRHLSQNAHKSGVSEALLLEAVNLAEAEGQRALIRQQDYLASSKAR